MMSAFSWVLLLGCHVMVLIVINPHRRPRPLAADVAGDVQEGGTNPKRPVGAPAVVFPWRRVGRFCRHGLALLPILCHVHVASSLLWWLGGCWSAPPWMALGSLLVLWGARGGSLCYVVGFPGAAVCCNFVAVYLKAGLIYALNHNMKLRGTTGVAPHMGEAAGAGGLGTGAGIKL